MMDCSATIKNHVVSRGLIIVIGNVHDILKGKSRIQNSMGRAYSKMLIVGFSAL